MKIQLKYTSLLYFNKKLEHFTTFHLSQYDCVLAVDAQSRFFIFKEHINASDLHSSSVSFDFPAGTSVFVSGKHIKVAAIFFSIDLHQLMNLYSSSVALTPFHPTVQLTHYTDSQEKWERTTSWLIMRALLSCPASGFNSAKSQYKPVWSVN